MRTEHDKEVRREWARKNKEHVSEVSRKWRQEHKDHARLYLQEYEQRKKKIVLTYYGNNRCACVFCGFDDIRALAIDHINGGGNQHRRELGRTANRHIYRWLEQQTFPEGFRTLCMNCQFIEKDKQHKIRKSTKSLHGGVDYPHRMVTNDLATTKRHNRRKQKTKGRGQNKLP